MRVRALSLDPAHDPSGGTGALLDGLWKYGDTLLMEYGEYGNTVEYGDTLLNPQLNHDPTPSFPAALSDLEGQGAIWGLSKVSPYPHRIRRIHPVSTHVSAVSAWRPEEVGLLRKRHRIAGALWGQTPYGATFSWREKGIAATLPSFHVRAIGCLGEHAHCLHGEAAGTVSAAIPRKDARSH